MRPFGPSFYQKFTASGTPCQLGYVGEGFLFCSLWRFCPDKSANVCRHGVKLRVEVGPGPFNPGPETRRSGNGSKRVSLRLGSTTKK
jgi:hypothetical protein